YDDAEKIVWLRSGPYPASQFLVRFSAARSFRRHHTDLHQYQSWTARTGAARFRSAAALPESLICNPLTTITGARRSSCQTHSRARSHQATPTSVPTGRIEVKTAMGANP